MSHNFKNNFVYLRKLNKWTQEETAEKLNIKRSSVGSYEEGRAVPAYDKLIEVCEMFFVTIDEMLTKDFRLYHKIYSKPTPHLKLIHKTG